MEHGHKTPTYISVLRNMAIELLPLSQIQLNTLASVRTVPIFQYY